MFVTVAATGLVIVLLTLVLGVRLERWGDEAGIERKGRRISTARSTVMLVLLFGGASFGTGFLILGGAWIALGAVLIVGGFVSGVVVAKTGPERPAPPPPSADIVRHEGLAYLWRCRLPQQLRDNGRAVGMAVVAPPGAVVLLVFGRWLPAALSAGLGAVSWIVLVRVKPESVPRRGPCARAE